MNWPHFDESTYPVDQEFRFFKLEAEDGSVVDYSCVWWNAKQMAMIPEEHRDEFAQARDQVFWLGFEALFNGTLPGYPKIKRIISERVGPKRSKPSGDN